MLYFVGENIDKTQSHYQVGMGKLVQLMRGIYAETDDDIDAAVLSHAVRIARYLYPNTFLAAASAVLLGPTRDGRLFLSGRRTQRTRIRGLEIIQNKAPKHPSVAFATVADSMGEFQVSISSFRQRFLEAFRIRSEHAASIDTGMRASTAKRLLEEYGTPDAASDAVWALARENGWYREGENAERFLLKTRAIAPPANAAAFKLIVAWHGTPVGTLAHDGFEWRWTPFDALMPHIIRQTTPGKLPPFIVSLLPEGWLESVLADRNEREMLRSGKRYMSNITTGGFEHLPIVEWVALSLGRAIGFAVPDTALIAMPDGMPPALLVERFDIRIDNNDTRLIAMEDMCSVLDLSPAAKYDGTMERIGRAVRPRSTSPEEDVMLILKRALFAWLIADGDMHLKNLAILKIGEPGETTFHSVRLAPLYDAVTTRVFPRLERDRMAVKLNGKDERLRRADFRKLAATMGLKASETDRAIDELLDSLRNAVHATGLPPIPGYDAESETMFSRMMDICLDRIASLE